MPISVGADVGGMVSGFLQYRAQQEANQIAWRNLLNQERWNNKILKLQTADREDAYGNAIRYIPGIGWRSIPTPSTKKLMDAEQRELLLSLTEDASRNRAALQRKDKRSRDADDLYEQALIKYKYPVGMPNEGALIADNVNRLLHNRTRANSEAASALARILMRTGGGTGAIEQVYREAAKGYGDNLRDAVGAGRRLGKAEYNQDYAAKWGKLMQDMEFLRSIANDTDNAPVRFTDPAGKITAAQTNALAALTAAMQGAQGASARAYEFAAKQFGDAPKFSGNVSFSGSGGDKDSGYERMRTTGDGWERIIQRPLPSNQGSFFF